MNIFTVEKTLDSDIGGFLTFALYAFIMASTILIPIAEVRFNPPIAATSLLIGILTIILVVLFNIRKKQAEKNLLIERIAHLLTSTEDVYPVGEKLLKKKKRNDHLVEIFPFSFSIELKEENFKKIENLSGYSFIAKENCKLIFRQEKQIKPKNTSAIPYLDVIEKRINESIKSLPQILSEIHEIFGKNELKKGYKNIEYKNKKLTIQEENIHLGKIELQNELIYQKIKYHDLLTGETETLYKTKELANIKYISKHLHKKGFETTRIDTYTEIGLLITIPLAQINKLPHKQTSSAVGKKYPEIKKISENIENLKEKTLPTEIQYELNQIETEYIPKIVNFYENKELTKEEFKDLIQTIGNFVEETKKEELDKIKVKAFRNFIKRKNKYNKKNNQKEK